MKLWLDDERNPIKHGFGEFIWVKTADEAIEILKKGEVKFASLDHDLGYSHYQGDFSDGNTGFKVLNWMEENNVWPEDGVAVHSLNVVERPKMELVIKKQYGRNFYTAHRWFNE